jgi:hypothetical protein
VTTSVENQPTLRDPLVWGQFFLVVVVALGLVGYDLVVFAYYAEFVVVLLLSLLLFTNSWRMLLRRVLELFVKSVALGLMMLIVLALIRGSKDENHTVYFGNLWWPMALITMYCALILLPVLRRVRRAANPAREWVHKVVTPQISIAGVFLIAIFGGQIASGVEGSISAVTHRLLEIGLMALSGVVRVVVARVCTQASASDIDEAYATFMNPSTLG